MFYGEHLRKGQTSYVLKDRDDAFMFPLNNNRKYEPDCKKLAWMCVSRSKAVSYFLTCRRHNNNAESARKKTVD